MLRPPSNPRHPARLPEHRADEGRRHRNPRAGALIAKPHTAVVAARLTRAERADWLAAEAGP